MLKPSNQPKQIASEKLNCTKIRKKTFYFKKLLLRRHVSFCLIEIQLFFHTRNKDTVHLCYSLLKTEKAQEQCLHASYLQSKLPFTSDVLFVRGLALCAGCFWVNFISVHVSSPLTLQSIPFHWKPCSPSEPFVRVNSEVCEAAGQR